MHAGVEKHGEPREVAGVLEEREHEVEAEYIREHHPERNEEPRGEKPERLLEIDPAVDEIADEQMMNESVPAERGGELRHQGPPRRVEERLHAEGDPEPRRPR